MDNDFSIDISEIASSVATSELVVLRFVTISERLLLDFRCNELDGPLIKLVPPVNSVQERYESLRRMRPRFARPEKIVVIWWPRFARSLQHSAVWNAVMERVSDAGFVEAVRAAEATVQELVQLERTIERNAITGEGFKTLWSASARMR